MQVASWRGGVNAHCLILVFQVAGYQLLVSGLRLIPHPRFEVVFTTEVTERGVGFTQSTQRITQRNRIVFSVEFLMLSFWFLVEVLNGIRH